VNSVSLLGRAGLTASAAAVGLGLMAAASALGAIVAGLLADARGSRATLIGVAALLAAALLLLGVGSPALSYAGLVGLGLANGFNVAATGTVWVEAFGTASIGRLQGLAAAGQVAGAALGPIPLAVSAAVLGGYAGGLMLLAGLAGVAIVASIRWNPPRAATAL
jgi:MFS family permease